MARIEVHQLTKEFGTCRAVDEVSLNIPDGGIFGLLGPSGCGKTTLLRLIAGFDMPTSGAIAIAGRRVETLPVERRGVGMMFQSYALFPNMSVAQNVGFGLSVRGVTGNELRQRVSEALELVQLEGFGSRRPHQLSGGQRQRVALARAIIIQPRVLLLDEPLSALDKRLRVGMQVELRRIQRETRITTIFVTHDQEEALTLCDRLAIMRDGSLIQEGDPGELYENPATAFAATFLGEANLLVGRSGSTNTIRVGESTFRTTHPVSDAGCPVTIAVRPEKMQLVTGSKAVAPDLNVIEARITQRVYAGPSLTYLLDWNGMEMKVFVQNRGQEQARTGSLVRVVWSPDHTAVLVS